MSNLFTTYTGSNVRKCALVLGCLLALSSGFTSVFATGPENISGTWNWSANNSNGRLYLRQNADGTLCGYMHHGALEMPGDRTYIEGIYVPAVRRIVFVRKGGNGLPFQFYAGYASRSGVRLGGTFSVWNESGGGQGNDEVDFNFHATKVDNYVPACP
jgi:hypothetical protein